MAFTHVRVPIRLGNLRIASFGLDFESPVSLSGVELQDIASTVTATWYTKLALYATDTVLQACTAEGQERVESVTNPGTFVRKPTSVRYTGAGAPVVGTAAGQSSSPGTSLVVSLRTALPGRRHQGRVYTPAPPESVIDGAGTVTDAATRATMVSDLAASVEGSIVPVDLDHIVWSITYDEQAEVIVYNTNGLADYQRRRGRQLS